MEDKGKAELLDLFCKGQQIYKLEELQQIVDVNSLQEILSHLLDEGLIHYENINSSLYYWSDPNKYHLTKKRKLEQLKENVENNRKRLKMEKEKDQSKKLLSRTKVLKEQVADLEIQRDLLKKKLGKYGLYQEAKLKRDELTLIRDAANRWTDNIFNIKTCCKNKYFMEDKVLNKEFSIPADLDYIN